MSTVELAELMLHLQSLGCHNINLVTPSHVVAQILSALVVAARAGLSVPLVWNSGGYDSVETLRNLDGVVDIYMPDFKYADPQAAPRAAWGQIVRRTGWRRVVLDWADPAVDRAPHYLEDADGWLRPPTDPGDLCLDARDGITICRAYRHEGRWPLALALFVRADVGPLMARVVVRGDRESSRRMDVFWAGRVAATFDAASYFETDRTFFVRLPIEPSEDMIGESII